jgi:hypothetical protein
MKGISRNIKTGIVLVIILVFVGSVVKVILDGYKGENANQSITAEDDADSEEKTLSKDKKLLSEKDIKEFEENYNISGGFYLYDEKDALVAREEPLEIKEEGYLDCSLEFKNFSKGNIQFTLLVFADGELQNFSVNGESETYFYNNKQLANRESDKIKIHLKPLLKDGAQSHKILFYMTFFPVDCYDDEQTIYSTSVAEHILVGAENASTNAEIVNYDYNKQVIYVDGGQKLEEGCYTVGLSNEPNSDMSFQKKITADAENKVYFKLHKNTGTYKAVVLRDGEIIPAFDDNYIIQWDQKKELSVIPIDTRLQDSQPHTFFVIFYSEDTGALEVHNSQIIIVSSQKQ